MTAGRGIVHSEMPGVTEGDLWGFQLWINLPKKDKMVKPRCTHPPNSLPPPAIGPPAINPPSTPPPSPTPQNMLPENINGFTKSHSCVNERRLFNFHLRLSKLCNRPWSAVCLFEHMCLT